MPMRFDLVNLPEACIALLVQRSEQEYGREL
jgi:hypothetical protein